MKKIAMVAVVVAMSFGAQANAEEGNLSSELLASTGLSGIELMTDADGESVRGMGYASVWGQSYSSAWQGSYYYGGAYTDGSNGYDGWGYNSALGGNASASVVGYGSGVGNWSVSGGISGVTVN